MKKSMLSNMIRLIPSQAAVYGNKPPPELTPDMQDWLKEVDRTRQSAARSVHPDEFKFEKRRFRMILGENFFSGEAANGPILYWMNRDQRVQDNWAFLLAQRIAMKFEVPLAVCFTLVPESLPNTERHWRFLLDGLRIVEEECLKLSIPFYLLEPGDVAKAGQKRKLDDENPAKAILKLANDLQSSVIVTDFSPLRLDVQMLDYLKVNSPDRMSIVQVDAHNVVPVWLASEKLEYGARTIRPKIHKLMPKCLTEFPPLVEHPHEASKPAPSIEWQKIIDRLAATWDRDVHAVQWCQAGYQYGMQMLRAFITDALPQFNDDRNDPTKPALSHLSPWLRFGQLSAQRCIIEVSKLRDKAKVGVEVFVEEALVRRELADNYCFYQPKYDCIEGAWDWAQTTLRLHAKDKRDPSFTEEEMLSAKTTDDLWNAAQRQLLITGKMHGFLRMYWCKKILEWHAGGPEAALKFAFRLNDTYSLDGTCPNGFVGVMWSICGIHDQGWAERQIFGKIRFMNYKGCQRKFDVKAFVDMYPAKSLLQQK